MSKKNITLSIQIRDDYMCGFDCPFSNDDYCALFKEKLKKRKMYDDIDDIFDFFACESCRHVVNKLS